MVAINKGQQLIAIEQLALIKNRFGKPFRDDKIKLLKQIETCKLFSVGALKKYHDCLLFLIAYPENQLLFTLAQAELKRVNEVLKSKASLNNETEQRQLFSSGMNHSKMICSYSYDLVKWLCNQYPEQIEFYSSDATSDKQQEVLRILMPTAQHQLIDEGNVLTFNKWLSLSVNSKNKNRLPFLISRFETLADEAIRDVLFASLKIFVSITLNDNMYSRSTGVALAGAVFYHDALRKKSNADFIFSNEPIQIKRLNANEKEHLLAVARMSLCCLQRETNPVTYAQASATEYYEMQRGISIALFTMKASRRLTLESYIGYMAFKNGVPVAYGGGWIYNLQSKIGINVYEPFRGGESAFIFTEVLRLYAARFNVKYFIAESYQIGKGNNDGINSGAFWFYYRLGFRPMEKELSALALTEFDKLMDDKNYRTPKATLKKLALSNMQLIDKGYIGISCLDLTKLSLAQIKNKAVRYNSYTLSKTKNCFDEAIKTLAVKDFKSWPVDEQQSFIRLSNFVVMIEELPYWSKKEKTDLVKLMRSKGSPSEATFIKYVQHHGKLVNGLNKIVTQP